MRTMHKIAAVTLVGLTLASTGCGESRHDAPVNNRDTGSADVINMPDGFSNVAAKCNGPNMVYTIYHGNFADSRDYGSIAVVANDPRCTASKPPGPR